MHEGGFVGAKQNTLVEDDAAAGTRFHSSDGVLQVEGLGRAGLVSKVGLGSFAFFAAKGWIHEDDIELTGGTLIESLVGDAPGEGVAVPNVG